MHWQRVTLVGVGLLGGSLGLALKQRGLASEVRGYVRRGASVAECQQLGAVDVAETELAAAVAGADLIILCTPIGQMRELALQMLPALRPGTVVTDVGSVKWQVVQDLEPIFQRVGVHFIGSHPMAGSEKTGVAAARPDLFVDATCAVTPSTTSRPEAVQQVESLWSGIGAIPLRISPELHDDLVGRCSHLPHIVAAELVNYVLSPVHPKEQSFLCGSGFRDTTRIASGSTELWRDICKANRRHLMRILGVFVEDLQEFRLALENEEWKTVEEFFDKARQRRDQWLDQTKNGEAVKRFGDK